LQSTISFRLIDEPSPQIAVLPNPVPDRQPCSALCRMAFLGPLTQTEIMTGFPEKYLIGRSFTFAPRQNGTWVCSENL